MKCHAGCGMRDCRITYCGIRDETGWYGVEYDSNVDQISSDYMYKLHVVFECKLSVTCLDLTYVYMLLRHSICNLIIFFLQFIHWIKITYLELKTCKQVWLYHRLIMILYHTLIEMQHKKEKSNRFAGCGTGSRGTRFWWQCAINVGTWFFCCVMRDCGMMWDEIFHAGWYHWLFFCDDRSDSRKV